MKVFAPLMPLAVLFIPLQGCSSQAVAPAELVGSWAAEESDSGEVSRMSLVLIEDGRFSATGVPLRLACPDSHKTQGVAGAGRWEFDAEFGRINLSFKEFSDSSCTPYSSNVFPERALGHLVIVAYPDGPDELSSRILLMKKRRGDTP